jgi:hypothetical protein
VINEILLLKGGKIVKGKKKKKKKKEKKRNEKRKLPRLLGPRWEKQRFLTTSAVEAQMVMRLLYTALPEPSSSQRSRAAVFPTSRMARH